MAKMNKALAAEVRENMQAWFKYWQKNNQKYVKNTEFVRILPPHY